MRRYRVRALRPQGGLEVVTLPVNELLLSGSVSVPVMSKKDNPVFAPRLGNDFPTVLLVEKAIESVVKFAAIETSAEVIKGFPLMT